ncbi:MAG TPA: DinB family protein [Terriglobales bacterium]|nr:DinB family protein [Terriglobales bacterium]
MGKITEPMLAELRQEAAITRRVLERVPEAKLAWKPHPKSMSLGELALHTAGIPGGLSKLALLEEFDAGQANFNPPSPKNVEEILAAHDQGVREAEERLRGMSDQSAVGTWRLLVNGKELFTRQRIDMLRSVLLNHWIHHRGQLSVYLRLLDVPVPVIYGRSADENPLA